MTTPDGTTYVSNTLDDHGRVVKQVTGDGKTPTIGYHGGGATTYSDTTAVPAR